MRTLYLQKLPADWRPAAGIFAALGDETRQKILLLFEPEEALSIKEIAALFPLGRTTVTHHLGVLERAGILVVRREGRLALYQLCHAPVLEALKRLRQLIVDDLKAANSPKRRMQAKTKALKIPLKPKRVKLELAAKKPCRKPKPSPKQGKPH